MKSRPIHYTFILRHKLVHKFSSYCAIIILFNWPIPKPPQAQQDELRPARECPMSDKKEKYGLYTNYKFKNCHTI